MERSFSLLKGRWRNLQYLDHLDLVIAVQIITATCGDDGYLLLGDADGGGDDDKSEQQGPLDHGPAQKKVHLINIVTAL